MKRAYWHGPVGAFLEADESHILGELTRHHGHSLEQLQRNAWIDQIRHLKGTLDDWGTGHVLFEYAIPRMGKRADVAGETIEARISDNEAIPLERSPARTKR